MTCLFWFESIDHLKKAETIRSRPSMLTTRLAKLAKPNEQFRKWVYNVLSTTQVTQNVILLALLFIYRLKLSTPQIKGREGSEYRLLTVALMLGNKCKAFHISLCPSHWGVKTSKQIANNVPPQSSTTTPIPTRRGPRCRASGSTRFTSWKSSS